MLTASSAASEQRGVFLGRQTSHDWSARAFFYGSVLTLSAQATTGMIRCVCTPAQSASTPKPWPLGPKRSAKGQPQQPAMFQPWSSSVSVPLPFPRRGSCGDIRSQLSQQLVRHKARVSCLAFGRDGKTLGELYQSPESFALTCGSSVTGSKDCTLLVWDVVEEEASRGLLFLFLLQLVLIGLEYAGGLFGGRLYVSQTPRHILRGHTEEVPCECPILHASESLARSMQIIGLAVDTELDLCLRCNSLLSFPIVTRDH